MVHPIKKKNNKKKHTALFKAAICAGGPIYSFPVLSAAGSRSRQVSRLVFCEPRHFVWLHTHTHTLVSRLQAEAALWAETLQNAMQNNNLPDTDAEYVDMQSSAARLPETPASFLTLKQNVGPIDLWILFCERIRCVLLNNSADIRHPQVFGFFFSPPFF